MAMDRRSLLRSALIGLALPVSGACGAGAATDIRVADAAGLTQALSTATGGETIVLAAGNYGMLQLIEGVTKFDVTHSAAAPVTIRSADAARPAVFTGLDMRNASGFTFEKVTFDYTYKAADQATSSPFMVFGGRDITIRGSTFDGDVVVNRNAIDNGHGFANGFSARATTNLTFEDNTISGFMRGVTVTELDNVRITGNDIHSIRTDGLVLSSVQGVLIENNHIHNFRHAPGSQDHQDFIQFFTNGSKRPNTDIVIRNNLLDIGAGDLTQSIFMRNEEVDLGRAGTAMFYRNVLIEQNTIYNDQLAGITLGEAAGVVIRNNTVLHANGRTENATGPVSIPVISVAVASTDVTIVSNVAGRVAGGLQGTAAVPPGWTLSNNLQVQDENATLANHYSSLFLSTSLDRTDGAHGFVARPGGLIETMGTGADRLLLDRTPATVTPQFNVSRLESDPGVHVFDAAIASFGPAGALTAAQGRFVWDLGDGTLASGPVVQHRYAAPGTYEVTLKFVQPNGTVTAASESVIKLPLDLLRFDRATGQFAIVTDTGETMLALKAGAAIGAAGTKVLDLGSPGVLATVPPKLIEGLFKADNFDLSLQLRADPVANNWGEMFRLHGTLLGTIRSTGDFSFTVWTDAGTSVTLTSRGVNLLDGRLHDISIRHDADLGTLRMVIDGRFTSEAPMTANLTVMGQHGLTFGNPWGAQNFNGLLTSFDINVDRSGYVPYTGTTPPVPSNLAPVPTDPDPTSPLLVTPLFEVGTLAVDGSFLVFDAASYSRSADGPLTSAQGRFIWNFGDGTFAEGGVVQHRYATPGIYDVTLAFVQPNGTVTTVSGTVDRSSPDLVRFDRATGQFGVATDTGETMVAARAGTAVGSAGAMTIDLGTVGVTAAIPRGMLGDLFSADNFALDLQLRADTTTTTWGEVFRLHGTFLGSVTRAGDFSFTLWTDGATPVTLVSQGVKLNDGRVHDISVRYDTDLGVLKLVVDGTFTTQAPLSANLPRPGPHDLTFGNPWNGQNFNGWMSNFDLNVERPDYPDYQGTTPPVSSGTAALAPGDVPAGVPGAVTAASLSAALSDSYLLDAAAMATMRSDQFAGLAAVETVGTRTVLNFEGQGDAVKLGVMEAFRDANQIAFTLDFQRASATTPDSNLVTNAGQVSLNIAGDGFVLQVATAAEGFKQYQIANLGLRDTDWHETIVLVDPVADRLQVFLDNQLVLEDLRTDLVMTNPQGHASGGWTLGQNFAGNIAAFGIVENVDHPIASGDVVLFS